jgi:hypothetical protein
MIVDSVISIICRTDRINYSDRFSIFGRSEREIKYKKAKLIVLQMRITMEIESTE